MVRPRYRIFATVRRVVQKLKQPNNATGVWFKALRQFHLALPKDPRKLLLTFRHCCVWATTSGWYFHMGSRLRLLQLSTSPNYLSYVKLQLNISGLKFYNSVCTQFWPKLRRIIASFASYPLVFDILRATKQNDARYHLLAVSIELYKRLKG